MKQRLTHLGTTPSGKKVFLEKLPHEYPRFSKSDHLYAAVLHGANRTRGGAVADLHRLAAGDRDRGSRSGRAAHATKSKGLSWEELAADYKRRAKAAREAGGKVKIYPDGSILVVPTADADEYFFQDWQSDELREDIEKRNREVLEHIRFEDLLLAQAQNW